MFYSRSLPNLNLVNQVIMSTLKSDFELAAFPTDLPDEEQKQWAKKYLMQCRILLKKLISDAQWSTVYKTREGLFIDRAPGPHDRDMLKLTFPAPLGIEETADRIHALGPYMDQYASQLDKKKTVLDIVDAENGICIGREFRKAQLLGLVPARESICLMHWWVEGGCYYFTAPSITHPDYPTRSNTRPFVNLPGAGWKLQKTDSPSHTIVSVVRHIDPAFRYSTSRSLIRLASTIQEACQIPDIKHASLPGWRHDMTDGSSGYR